MNNPIDKWINDFDMVIRTEAYEALQELFASSRCLHQIQEPAAAEQAAWHAGLDEGRAQAAPAAVAVPDERAALTDDERAFVETVKQRPGEKLNSGEAWGADGNALWEKPESLGLIRCVGSYKWVAAPVVVPAGWKLVPVKATEEMIEVFDATGSYEKMLSAAPQSPTPETFAPTTEGLIAACREGAAEEAAVNEVMDLVHSVATFASVEMTQRMRNDAVKANKSLQRVIDTEDAIRTKLRALMTTGGQAQNTEMRHVERRIVMTPLETENPAEVRITWKHGDKEPEILISYWNINGNGTGLSGNPEAAIHGACNLLLDSLERVNVLPSLTNGQIKGENDPGKAAAAAPVVLPEPDAAIAEVMGLVESYADAVSSDMELQYEALEISIKSKLLALLATATGLPAQAVETGEVLGWVHKRNGKIGHHFYTYEPHCDSSVRDDGGEKIAVIAASSAAPQSQADTRDALTPAKPVHPKGMTSINARLSFNMGWMACERHHGIRAEDVEQAVATDAAIAAAKGE